MKRQLSKTAGANYIEYDDWFYVGCDNNNAICRISKTIGKVELLGSDELSSCFDEMIWAKSAIVDNKVLFAPFSGRSVYIYDTSCDSMQRIDYDYHKQNDLNTFRFWQTLGYNGFFYLFGFGHLGIIKIDAHTYNIEYIGFRSGDFSGAEYCFSDGYVLHNDKLYLCTGVSDRIFQYNLKNDEYELLSINADIGKFQSISANGDEFWLCTDDYDDSRIVIFNIESHESYVLDLQEKGKWLAPIFHDNYAYFFPCIAKTRALKVNTNTFEVKVFEEVDQKLRGDNDHSHIYDVYAAQKGENSITFIRRLDCVWFTYDFDKKMLTERAYEIEDVEYISRVKREYREHLFKRAKDGNVIIEEDELPLQDFIDKLSQ